MIQQAYPSYPALPWSPAQSDELLTRRHLLTLEQIRKAAGNRSNLPPEFTLAAKEILGIIRQGITFDAAWVVRLNPQNFRYLKVYLHRFSRAAFSEYLRTFQDAIPKPNQMKVNRLISQRGSDLSDRRRWRTSPFYQTVLKPLGLASYLMAICIDPEGKYSGLICLWRSESRRDFSPSDRLLLEKASEDCAVLLKGNRRSGAPAKESKAVPLLKRGASPGIVVLGSHSEVIFMNEEAESLLTLISENGAGEETRSGFFSILQRVRDKIYKRHTLFGRDLSNPEGRGTSVDHLFTFLGISFSCRGTVLEGEKTDLNLVLLLIEAEKPANDRETRQPRGALQKKKRKEEFGLTEQEDAVARLISRGLTNKEVASELGISVHTIKGYVKRIMQKLEVNTRSGVATRIMTAE